MKLRSPKQINMLALAISLIISLFIVTPVPAEEKVYEVGIVPQFEARRLYEIWKPILDHLEKETGYKFKLSGSPTIPDFENEFMQGRFDFAYMNPYHMILANKDRNYIPLVRDVGRKLHGVLVVRKDSGIKKVTDLNGKDVAFPAPNALGASLQMRQELNDIFHIKIKPKYVKTHDSVYLNVLLKEAAAGGGVQKTLNRQKESYRSALTIIHRTKDVAPHPFAVHPRVPDKVRRSVREALLKLGKSANGSALLSKIPMKKIGKSSMNDYLPLNKMGLERFYVKSNKK